MIHDTHRARPHAPRAGAGSSGWSPRLAARVYAASLHRLRLDDRIDAAFAPVLALAAALDRADRWLRRTLSLDGPRVMTPLDPLRRRRGRRWSSACCCSSRRSWQRCAGRARLPLLAGAGGGDRWPPLFAADGAGRPTRPSPRGAAAARRCAAWRAAAPGAATLGRRRRCVGGRRRRRRPRRADRRLRAVGAGHRAARRRAAAARRRRQPVRSRAARADAAAVLDDRAGVRAPALRRSPRRRRSRWRRCWCRYGAAAGHRRRAADPRAARPARLLPRHHASMHGGMLLAALGTASRSATSPRRCSWP